jgi:23S rRNA pseudouridine955/2504/2580 synthase/23S rRNA pseudouridine1911/1915/1917 synthase
VNAAVKLSSPATHEFWEIPVLHEDGELLALDKPAGLLVSPDRFEPERPSLMSLLHEGIAAGKPWARERQLTYLANAHRLEVDTTGVLLLAKTKTALVALADQFGTDAPARTYLVLAQGVPPEDTFASDVKIGPHPLQNGRMRIDSRNGKKSRTEFTVLEKFSRWSLLRCVPRMERPQQIGLHLNYAGFPVVGDEVHGGKKLWLSRLKRDFHLKPGREERPLISRAALHAEEFRIVHPVTHETVTIKSEWPKDLRVAVKYLRLYGKGAGLSVETDADDFAA